MGFDRGRDVWSKAVELTGVKSSPLRVLVVEDSDDDFEILLPDLRGWFAAI